MKEINDQDISKPLFLNNSDKKHLSILKKIFHVSPLNQNTFLPIIRSTEDIPRLFYYLNKKKDLKDDNKDNNDKIDDLELLTFDNKIEILKILISLFKSSKNLINLFTNKCKSNVTYFLEPIIDIYLSKELKSDSDMELIEQNIIYMVNNVTIPKFLLECVYQKLAVYLRYNSNKGKINKLNQHFFMRYLNLLEIFYTNSLDNNINKIYNISNENEADNLIDNYIENEQKKEIKNYIYFNGYNSKMTLLLNQCSNNINCDFPTLELGCSFVFWINLDKNIINNYYTINNEKDNNKRMKLISFILGGHQIVLQLINVDNLLLILDDIESSPINISQSFKYGNWNNICFIIYPKKILSAKIIINGNIINHSINIPKNYNLNTSEKLDNITLFENLIGRVNSVLFCGNTLNSDLIKFFGISQGFHKIKYLYKFLLSLDNNYYKYSHDYKYYKKFKNIGLNKSLSKININAEEQNIKNIVGLFCPFTYDEIKNQIDDVFGNYIAVISTKDDGVNNYIKYSKNIEQIGDINNLLPIMEIMLLSHNPNKLWSSINMNNDAEIENLLTEDILLKYMHIIKKIITGNKTNLISANNSKFFSHLGLFLEKFPSKIFTKTILNIFYEIGKETFQYTETNDKNKVSYTFVHMVLLNEKIFSKFSEENQLKLWDDINKFFTSDYSQLKDSLNISKICLLLRFYDKDRYNKYCCKKHANLFKLSEEDIINNIMDPDMNTKVEKLFETIQLYVNILSNESDTVNLFKLLSLDLSPCLQKKIIKTYQHFFDNHKISEEIKVIALDNLINNNFFEIFEYVLSVSLLDVRIELLDLFRIISIKYKEKIEKYIKENELVIMEYLGEYLFPDNLNIIIDNNYNKLIKLNDYFNKEIYNNDIASLWIVLNNWITSKYIMTITEKNEQKMVNCLYANQSVINIFIQFISKVSPYYIDGFLLLLFSLLTNVTIYNRNIFLNNDNFYKWLFEIIFFFNNKCNEKLIEEKEKSYIDLIKLHSMELFKNYIKIIKRKGGYITIINYLIDYSYYLKNKNKGNADQINEITNITRILLTAIVESSSWTMIDLTKVCFEFMFLYKNNYISPIEEDKKEDQKEDKKDFKKNIKNRRNISKSFSIINTNNTNEQQIDLEEDLFESIKEVEEEEIKTETIEKTKTKDLNDVANSLKKRNTLDEYAIIDDINSSFDNDDSNKRSSKGKKIDKFLNSILIPDYLYDNLYMKESKENNISDENIQSNVNINLVNNILKDIWKDCNMYDYIIDYFYSNVWGIEKMCKNVKIDYDKKSFDIFKELLKEYGDKENKNLLINILNNCLIHQDNNNIDINNDYYKINIFNLNIILICIAYDTSGDPDEKNFIENKLEQFLIFCILCSVNITTSEKTHDDIQNKLYNLLGYGLLFLKKRDENKYSDFIEKIILPFFEEQNDNQKKGIKGIFSSKKKTLYKHTIIYKLFAHQETEDDNIRNSDKKILSRTLRTKTVQYKPSFNTKDSKDKIPMFESSSGKKMPKVKIKEKNKDKKNIKIIFNGDISKIIKNIIDDTIKLFKKVRCYKKENYIKEFYYKNNENINKQNQLIIKENNKIKEKILNIIPIIETQIKKYSSTSLIHEKKRRNKYKKVKKILFSWRGFWSQRDLFYEHPENLKLKIKNHFTKEMTKIIFSPILDIDYYMPPFSKFNIQKLFNKEDFKYKVNLNIDNLLMVNENDIEEQNNNNNENKNVINIEEEKKENKDNKKLIISKNKYGFNYLECIYKLTHTGLWEQYKTYYEQKINIDKSQNQNINNDAIDDLKFIKTENNNNIINKEKDKKKNKNKNTFGTSAFKCCLVKNTHHIHGYIICKKNKIKFIYSQEEMNRKLTMAEIMEDPSYDKDMNNCFGSTFNKNLKDKDKVYIKINYKNIKYIFIRNYFYQNTGMEIYTTNHKSYFFNFKASSDFDKYINQLKVFLIYREIKTEDNKGKKLLGYEQMFEAINEKKIKTFFISNKIEEWQNYKISTMEYLMWLNIYSGRSFNDLTQYPVFPWIISNYNTDKLEEENNFRNLSLPIGMMEYNDKSIMRKETFIETYDTVKNDLKETNHDFNYQDYLKKGDEYYYNYRNKKLKLSQRNFSMQISLPSDFDISANPLNNNPSNINVNDNVEMVEINQIPSYYRSHYSNPTYVSHYLARIFPYSFVSIEIQGEKFDDPNRIFHSMEKTYESCMTLKDDIRELIPEFYTLPEMFENNNNLNLTQDLLDLEGKKIEINDVQLPPWAENSPYKFVSSMRYYLEREYNKVNKWIDLIFGTYQKRGKSRRST